MHGLLRVLIDFVRDYSTAYGLAKVVGEHLRSEKAKEIVREALEFDDSNPGEKRKRDKAAGIRARTARNWLKQLDFDWKEVRKGVYIDGHERPDVITVHLPKMHWSHLI